jgi:hypothetical protein
MATAIAKNPEASLLDIAKCEQLRADHALYSMADFVDIEVQAAGTEDEKSFPVWNFKKAEARGCLHVIKKLRIKAGFKQAIDGGEPLPWTETDLELYDSHHSVEAWLKLHGYNKDGAGEAAAGVLGTLWAGLLSRLPPEVLRSLEQARVAGKPIDVPALVVGGNGDG